jgi:uncharacterized protein YdeI (YjbR/CyaY-like superfamily)
LDLREGLTSGRGLEKEGPRLKSLNLLHLTARAAWRSWLRKNHKRETEVWLVYAKRLSGEPRVEYEDAVEEALCFGWIDSLVRRIDDRRYAQKFTPRREKSKWSASNLRRIANLRRQGRLTSAAVLPPPELLLPYEQPNGTRRPAGKPGRSGAVAPPPPARPQPTSMPALSPRLRRMLREHERAWENFSRLAPSHRRNYIAWIMSAKREETRDRRLAEAIGLLERGEKLGMK